MAHTRQSGKPVFMLVTLVVLLAAAVVFVSISQRLKFGSILGYLVAGVAIGPYALRLVTDVGEIHSISELGVLMLLFLIGLELRPQRIWVMRRAVFGLGPAQILTTGAVLCVLIGYFTGVDPRAAIVLGLGLTLSSTAIALPMLSERDLLTVGSGRDTFAVLLFQDVVTVPLVAALPLLSQVGVTGSIWPPLLKGAAAVAAILLGGRYLMRPLFRAIGRIRSQEVFTAGALLTVTAAAAIAEVAGLPMSLGAFAAGVILSDSEYRHELQVDIEPFEGLLLGFFFISIGMAANMKLAVTEPVRTAVSVLVLIIVKTVICFGLELLRGKNAARSLRFALSMPQGSEFGIVLFGAALQVHVFDDPTFERATLVIALSMAVAPLLFPLSERFIVPRLVARTRVARQEMIDVAPAPVIIAGFGRVGQIVGRAMKMRKIAYNAIDNDADNIDLVRRFGSKASFGDPTRVELLRAVGAEQAKILVVALANPKQSMDLVARATMAFPHLKIYARARNRRHAYLLMNFEVEAIVRETYFSALRLIELVLQGVGLEAEDARRTVETFRERDEKTLILQRGIYDDEKQLIQSAKQAAQELEELFEDDSVQT